MKFDDTTAYSAKAAHCINQSNLSQDAALRQYWANLADDWIALDSMMTAVKSIATSNA